MFFFFSSLIFSPLRSLPSETFANVSRVLYHYTKVCFACTIHGARSRYLIRRERSACELPSPSSSSSSSSWCA
uniref:Putative secreted protein n=1 Tax=Anopheles darlingi TaxID=43151 RepID=A0A2M4D5H2_ANODA